MADAALRQILMLKRVPRAPRKITTKELQVYLRDQEDMKVTERTIQRDLLALVDHLPLQCDDRNKPFGWSFRKDADLSIAAMDANTAITLDMVQRFLTKLMPSQALNSLRPQMEAAQKHLAQGMQGKTRWSDKVAMLPRGLPLIPAPVNPRVLEAVYTALLENRAMDVIRNNPDRPERIHPLGIVHMMVEVQTLDEVGQAMRRAQQAGVHFLATLGRHVNDNMCSIYLLAPGGIAVEYGYDGLLIDWEDHVPTISVEGDLWGHEYNFPGVN